MRHKERIIGKEIYNPISRFPSPGGLSQYIPARCGELAGVTLDARLDGLAPMTIHFLDRHILAWAYKGEAFREETYDCVKNDDTTCMVAFSLSGRTPDTLMTLVWDRASTLITAVLSTLGANGEQPRLVHATVYFGAEQVSGRPLVTGRHTYTDELVGKRILWQYTPNDSVMHIFRSENRMRLWLVQPELADTATPEQRAGFQRFIDRRAVYPIYEEPIVYIKLKEELYLYLATEANLNHVLPKQGGSQLMVMLNTRRERYVGCVYGGDADNRAVCGIIGAIGCFSDEPDEVEAFLAPFYPDPIG